VTQKVLILFVLLAGLPAVSNGYNDRLYYPYASAQRGYGFPYRHPQSDLEVSRLRQDLREQRLYDDVARRRQNQELDLLRQQTVVNHQISAQQACYYRSTGGFELCVDLYADKDDARAACDALVVQRNPSCNAPPLTDMKLR
jgi:hypothetical protein